MPDGLTPEQLQGRIHQTLTLVRDNVESELRHGHRVPAAAGIQPASPLATPPAANGKEVIRLWEDICGPVAATWCMSVRGPDTRAAAVVAAIPAHGRGRGHCPGRGRDLADRLGVLLVGEPRDPGCVGLDRQKNHGMMP